MRLRALGPVEAVAHNAPLFLGGPKHREVLRCLALRANSVVSMDDLLFALWGRRPPRTGRKMVQNIVADLRGVLAQDDDRPALQAVLLTHAPGYLLRIKPEQVDALCFAREVREGLEHLRRGDRDRGVQSLRTALDRWPPTMPPVSGWREHLELWRLRERATCELEAASAEAAGTILMITADTAQAPAADIEHLARHTANVIAVLRDEIARHSGAVHTEFGSLIAAVFPDSPGCSGEPGQKRARAAVRAIRARLVGDRATVSVVLSSLPTGSGAPDRVPDTMIDEGMRLLAAAAVPRMLAADPLIT